MRSVSSAIWTRVLPVSLSFAPNCLTIYCVCSGVSVAMLLSRVATETPLRGDFAGGRGVLAHLLDERVDAREAALAAQPLEELDLQRLVVEIAVPIDEEGLDQLAAPG